MAANDTTVVDYPNSYMTFFAKNEGNIARIWLDASCTMTDEKSGASETYYLIAPCRSERMYVDKGLNQLPNYEFCGIWSRDEFLIIRTAWITDRDNRQQGKNRERFEEIKLDIRTRPARALPDEAAILRATLDNVTLVARTEWRDEKAGRRAVMEYPIKTMNVLRAGPRFQVDTGPIIVPSFGSTAEREIERFEMAYAVYNTLEGGELILRKPVALPAPEKPVVWTTDYSEVITPPMRHQFLAVP